MRSELPNKKKRYHRVANFLSAHDEKINHCAVQIEKMEDWKKGFCNGCLCHKSVPVLPNLNYFIPVFSLQNLSLSTYNFNCINNFIQCWMLNILSKGSLFDKAKTLREKQHIVRDNGESLYFEFISNDNWCPNLFQVTYQVSMEGN
ncbi:MAG: hypothetical protein PHT07_14670 [Paludibacter sp.]|nr:hypothetical protein [Paludibacter sp.]